MAVLRVAYGRGGGHQHGESANKFLFIPAKCTLLFADRLRGASFVELFRGRNGAQKDWCFSPRQIFTPLYLATFCLSVMDYIFRCTKNLVLRYQVSDIFHANELTVYDATLLYIHRYYNIYISDFFSRPRSLLLLPSSLLIFFAHKENTPSFDSISILSTHGPHVSLFLSLSPSLSLIHQSRSILFLSFLFRAATKDPWNTCTSANAF